MIDWAKPIEHVDGTPLVWKAGPDNPGPAGDYYVTREDGRELTHAQRHPYGAGGVKCNPSLIVKPNGHGRNPFSSHSVQIVRNRVAKQTGVNNMDYVFKVGPKQEPAVPIRLALEEVGGYVRLRAYTGGGSQTILTLTPGEGIEFISLHIDTICAALNCSRGEKANIVCK